MLDYWDTAILDGEADEAFAATGNDAVDRIILLEQDVERPSVSGGYDLDGVFIDACFFERCTNYFGEFHITMICFLTAAKD